MRHREASKKTLLANGMIVALGLGSLPAFAQQVLPMYNYKLPSSIRAEGSKLYAGVQVNAQSNGELTVNPTSTIYFEPKVAEVLGTAFARNSAANCSVIATELASEDSLATTSHSLIQLLNSEEFGLNETVKDALVARQSCIAASADAAALSVKITEVEPLVAVKRAEVTAQRTNVLNCRAAALSPDECKDEEAALTSLATELGAVSTQLSTLQQSNIPVASRKARECSNATALAKAASDTTNMVAGLRADLGKLQESVTASLIRYGDELGGSAVAVVSNQASQQKAQLDALNPGYDFRPVDAENVQFQFLAEISDLTRVPKRTVLGVAVQGSQPSEGAGITGGSARIVASGSGSTGIALTLSRLGACSEKLVRGVGYFYDYNAYSFVKGSASYRKFEAYEKVEQTTSSGGLFSSSSAHSLWEDMKSEQTFKFAVATDDPNINAQEMKQELRAELMDQLVKNWMDVKTLASGPAMGMPAPGAHGAQVLADGLMKTCPHIYCTAGSFALKGLDAIFGKDKSREEIRRTMNTVVKEEFGWTRVYPRRGTSAGAVTWQVPLSGN